MEDEKIKSWQPPKNLSFEETIEDFKKIVGIKDAKQKN
jgi:hypothetical protein